MPNTTTANITLVRFNEQSSTPSTPASGYSGVYMKADGLYAIDDAGNVTGPLRGNLIGDLFGSDYAEFESDGTLTFVGAATFWTQVHIPATSMVGGGSAPGVAAFLGAGGLYAYSFDGAGATEQLFFNVEMPGAYKEDSNIQIHVHWAPTTADAGNVVWQLEYTWANVDAAFGATATLSVTDAAAETAWTHQECTFSAITGTGKDIDSVLVCRIFRDSTDGSDNYTHDAALLYVDCTFECDTIGSRTATTK